MRDDISFIKGKVVVPKESTLLSLIILECYNTLFGGHACIQHTYIRIATTFYGLGL